MWQCLFQRDRNIIVIRTENIDWFDHKSNFMSLLDRNRFQFPLNYKSYLPTEPLLGARKSFLSCICNFPKSDFSSNFNLTVSHHLRHCPPPCKRESIVLHPFPEPLLPWATYPISHFFNNLRFVMIYLLTSSIL